MPAEDLQLCNAKIAGHHEKQGGPQLSWLVKISITRSSICSDSYSEGNCMGYCYCYPVPCSEMFDLRGALSEPTGGGTDSDSRATSPCHHVWYRCPIAKVTLCNRKTKYVNNSFHWGGINQAQERMMAACVIQIMYAMEKFDNNGLHQHFVFVINSDVRITWIGKHNSNR